MSEVKLTRSQKKRARKKRSKLAKQSENREKAAAAAAGAKLACQKAALDKAESAVAGEVVDAADLSNTDIAALLAKARAMATREGTAEERVGGAMDALKYVLQVQKARGGDDLVKDTLDRVKASKALDVATEPEESAAAKEARRNELRERLRVAQGSKRNARGRNPHYNRT